MTALEIGIEAIERGLVPDAFTRQAIRLLCRERLQASLNGARGQPTSSRTMLLDSMRSGPIALVPEKANQQHYELPPEFFTAVLGPRRKYSCCYFSSGSSTLAEAEEEALAITCQRAGLANDQAILELGCGWGSLSLWMAERFPGSHILAVSNSAPQRQFIEAEASSRRLGNLRVVTADINVFSPGGARFDRVVSVEMFEHLRNYELLLSRIASWLRADGKLFAHIFCHRDLCYPFEAEGAANWMGRHFFTGGLMPSADLFKHFNRDLKVTQQYQWSGRHYQRTGEAWLANLDQRRGEVLQILKAAYGVSEAKRWLNRWRMFFLAVAELFGFAHGEEWFVSHYLLERVARSESDPNQRN
jgi:cyclopropane-fatty-acyl-phospholipid synthase